MRSTLAIFLAALVLSGCAQMAQRMQAQQEANEVAWCRARGAEPGTPYYYDCRMRLVELGERQDEIRQAAYANMIQTGAAMMANGR
jgi:hypothetical protein